MARSSFSPCVCPTFHSGRGDSEAGFLIICFNPHPSFFMPGSGPSLAFGAPNLCLFTLDCLWRCVINLHGRPEVDLKGICEESVLINGKWWTGRDGVCVCVGGNTVLMPEQMAREKGEKYKAAHAKMCNRGLGAALLMRKSYPSWAEVNHQLPWKSWQPSQPCAAWKDFLVIAQIQETNISPLF